MKLNKKIDIKSISAVFVLLALVLVAAFSLSFYKNKQNFDNKGSLANSIDAARNIFQQYSTLPDLEGLSKEEGDAIRAEVNEAINNIDIAMIDIFKQISEIDPKVKVFQDQIRAIDVEIALMSEGLKEKNARVAVFINSASIVERSYIQKKSECERLLNITSAQKKAKAACNTKVAKLKKDLDIAVAKINSERNKLPSLESQKITADKNYNDKVIACGKLLNNTAAQKKKKTACDTQATNLKKIADDLGVLIEAEKRYFEIEARIKQKQEEKNPIINQAMALYQQQNYLRNIKDSAQTIKDQLTPLRDRFKETEPPKQPKPGCMDLTAKNFDPEATENDGTCDYGNGDTTQPPLVGVCTEPDALNSRPASSLDSSKGEYSDSSVCEWPPIIPEIPDENPGTPIEPTACTCPSGAPLGNTNQKVYNVKAFITHFGGKNDTGVTPDEPGSVSGENLRSLDTDNDKYIAWPMPAAEKSNGLLDTAECYGPEKESWPGERISKANQALNKQNVQVTYGSRTTTARIVDRGPGNPGRIDASKAVWSALGLLELADLGPNTDHGGHEVDLRLQLTPKEEGPGGCPQ